MDLTASFPVPAPATLDDAWRVLTLRAGYNTSVVTVATTLLGVAAGVCGTFALLRKRALMGDALAHATLPGIAIAFIVSAALGADRKSFAILLVGAACTGVLGVLAVHLLTRYSRLREDAAIGVVLSVFFGAGVTLMSVIQSMSTGTQAGLHHYIYGHTASLIASDAMLMGALAALALAAAGLLFKEFRIVCFDDAFAAVQGWPVHVIDALMMSLLVLVTVIGLQSVGLLLVIALLIIPAATARFWTERLGVMTILSGFFGGLSGWIGSTLSAIFADLPAGAIIVLVSAGVFAASLLLAPSRGVLATALRGVRLRFRVARQHVFRAMYERLEAAGDLEIAGAVPVSALARGPAARLLLRALAWRGWLSEADGGVRLTARGREEAVRLTRNHRLWEEYLVTYAHLAPSHVHRAADMVEHVISNDMVEELEGALRRRNRLPGARSPLPSVHATTEDGAQ